MYYFILFLEGIITFISPCLLPMIPIYISFFAGQSGETAKAKSRTLRNALGFVLGFTLVFTLLGAFAGTLGRVFREYSVAVNLTTGLIVILFGLNFMEIIRIPFLNQSRQASWRARPVGFFSSALFGVIFSVGWTPCVGAFLGSALMMAASEGHSLAGVLMLLCFSAGLGVPFIASALLIDRLQKSFAFIKRHYRVINLICGGFLVLIGLFMATGMLGRFLSILTF